MAFLDGSVTERCTSLTLMRKSCFDTLENGAAATRNLLEPVLTSRIHAENRVAAFAQFLLSKQESIAAELSYQSYATSQDELKRSIECMASIQELHPYLGRRTQMVCVFLPLNLPIYSLILFGVIPSLIADAVHIRPPHKMMTTFRQLPVTLNLHSFFPNIHIIFEGREDFIKHFVVQADVTIFTGKESNARQVMSKTRRDSLFIFNGWGCNPIVVSPDADLSIAVAKTVEAKIFNSGQDCAGPDAILVHRDIAPRFVDMLKDHLSRVKVGDYKDPEVTVGKITEEGRLSHLSAFLLKHQLDIVYGGCVDYQRGIVHPTVLVSPLAEKTNFQEFFSPIFFMSIFDDDQQLAAYFSNSRYRANEMYVSLFGTSPYVETLRRSILIQDRTIFDIERGNNAYGGMSVGASFVRSNGKIEAKPILVPREISEYLDKASNIRRLTSGGQKRIHKEVSKAMVHCFGPNLVFGFIFGSIAQGCATHKSDIDTMVVVESQNSEQSTRYVEWLREYHLKMDMIMDEIYPAEILTRKFLDEVVASLERITLNLEHTEIKTFDNILWAVALSGCKRALIGDQELLFEYARKVGKYPKLWKHQVLRELDKSVNYAGPNGKDCKKKAIQQLANIEQMDPALVLKRFIGLEHLSPDQRRSAQGLIYWDNDWLAMHADSKPVRCIL